MRGLPHDEAPPIGNGRGRDGFATCRRVYLSKADSGGSEIDHSFIVSQHESEVKKTDFTCKHAGFAILQFHILESNNAHSPHFILAQI